MVVSHLAFGLLLGFVLAGGGETAAAEVEAALCDLAGGGHEAPPLRAVRAGLADAVLLADGGVGGLVHQHGVQPGRGHGIGP